MGQEVCKSIMFLVITHILRNSPDFDISDENSSEENSIELWNHDLWNDKLWNGLRRATNSSDRKQTK